MLAPGRIRGKLDFVSRAIGIAIRRRAEGEPRSYVICELKMRSISNWSCRRGPRLPRPAALRRMGLRGRARHDSVSRALRRLGFGLLAVTPLGEVELLPAGRAWLRAAILKAVRLLDEHRRGAATPQSAAARARRQLPPIARLLSVPRHV